MKAIVQDGYGSADGLALRDVDQPAVAADTVLVRVRAASINAADCHMLHMPRLPRLPLGSRTPRPRIPGMDMSGVVDVVGANVAHFKPGDAVFGTARSTFAEFACAKENRVASKPRGLTFQQAAAVPLAGITALQGLRDKARVEPGQRVLIHGAGGGVGTFAVQIAKALGAHVTAVTGSRNLEIVRSLGPDELIDYTRDDFARRGQRWDVFFDIAATRPLRDCLGVLEPKGTFVGVGAAKGGMGAIFGRLLGAIAMSFLVSQRVVMMLAVSRRADLLALTELIEAGKVRPVIDREFALGDVPDAIRYVTDGLGRAKVVVTVD